MANKHWPALELGREELSLTSWWLIRKPCAHQPVGMQEAMPSRPGRHPWKALTKITASGTKTSKWSQKSKCLSISIKQHAERYSWNIIKNKFIITQRNRSSQKIYPTSAFNSDRCSKLLVKYILQSGICSQNTTWSDGMQPHSLVWRRWCFFKH